MHKNKIVLHVAFNSIENLGDALHRSERVVLKVLGITGGIGCGKSTVSRFFQSFGLPCIDADLLCHELYEKNVDGIVERIRSVWGDRVVDASGKIDRKALADAVFSSEEETSKLNAIVLPIAKTETLRRIDAYRSRGEQFLILDAPLLFEVGWSDVVDVTIAVWAPEERQDEFMRVNRGWDDEEIQRRKSKQMSAMEKLERADYGVINSGDLQFLREQCERTFQAIHSLQ